MLSATMEFHNDGVDPKTVFIEPWAWDYTLLPGQHLTVIAWGETQPTFALIDRPATVQIYCNGCDDFRVESNGVELEFAHNREWSIEPG